MKKTSNIKNRVFSAILVILLAVSNISTTCAMHSGKTETTPHTETPIKCEDRYVFIRKIGRGGFGSVDLYRDTELNGPVTIKTLLNGGKFSEEQLEKMRKIDSPYVAKIYGMTKVNRQDSLVMEYVDGGMPFITAAAVRKYSGEKLLNICIQLVKAFKAFCDAGLEHKDLGQHTGNVLIDRSGNVKIIDYEDAWETQNPFFENICQALIHIASLLNAADTTLYDKLQKHLPGVVFLTYLWGDNTKRMYPGGIIDPNLKFEDLIKILEDMKSKL